MKTPALLALLGLSCITPPLLGQGSTPTDRASAAAPRIIPEEARRHFVMGETMFKEAKSTENLSQAAGQFAEAARLAPEWPEARYNLALAEEAAGDNISAMADLKLYQQFKLTEADARTVQDKIYALEAKQQMKTAESAAKSAAEAEKAASDLATAQANSPEAKAREFLNSLNGAKWRYDLQNSQGGFCEITCSDNTLVCNYFIGRTGEEWRATIAGKEFTISGYKDYGDGPPQGRISDDGRTISVFIFSRIQGNVTQVFSRE